MKPELEPLDADIADLLAEERVVPEIDARRRAALFASVAAHLDLPPPGGSDGPDGGGTAQGGGSTTAGTAGAAGAAGALPGGATAAFSGVRAAIALATTFALGVGTGVAVDRAASSPAPPPSPPSTIVAHAAPDRPAAPVDEIPTVPVGALPSAPPVPALVTGARTESSANAIPSAHGLAAERALLDVARAALARGEASEAGEAAERHAREYPDGALVEEREAIAIKALVALGRREEARARARDFARRFPRSLTLRAVQAAVGEQP